MSGSRDPRRGGLGGLLGGILQGVLKNRQQRQQPQPPRRSSGGVLGDILGGGSSNQRQRNEPSGGGGILGDILGGGQQQPQRQPTQRQGGGGLLGGILGGVLGNRNRQGGGGQAPRRGGGLSIKMLLVIGVIAFGAWQFWQTRSVNDTTGETQFVALTAEQEISLGLSSAPQMAAQHGGLYQDQRVQDLVDRIGWRLVKNSAAGSSAYADSFEFSALADTKTVNAFALPGGQTFITMALLQQLQTEDEVAGVIAHEIAHVVHRHGAERIAKDSLLKKVAIGGAIATVDFKNPSTYKRAAMPFLVTKVIGMKFGRDDEHESDMLGIEFMVDAGYDPEALLRVMDVLEKTTGGRTPEFMSTHPSPKNRREKIIQKIKEVREGKRITKAPGSGATVEWR